MSKTAQRKRQAYEEGLRHGRAGYGCLYRYHPYMDSYMRGQADGRAQSAPPTILERIRRRFA